MEGSLNSWWKNECINNTGHLWSVECHPFSVISETESFGI